MSSVHHIHIADLSILLIEPSTPQLKIISNFLGSEDIVNIEKVNTGKAALISLQEFQPDLIISSMYLPDMTAASLIDEIKHSNDLKNIPFILISSETKFSALDPIRQAGVIAILPKPFSQIDLKRALSTTIELIDPEKISLEHFNIEDIRVLLVDDSIMARNHIAHILNSFGITQITQAQNGHEGIDIFSQSENSFDLIITDYNMPEMDGRELIEYIRNKLKNDLIPILMVTSEENKTRLHSIQQAGVSAICEKPFDLLTIKEILFRTLDGAN